MMIALMRTLLVLVVMAGCGGREDSPDAAVDASPDARPALDCQTYCALIEANCAGENDQYPDSKHCEAACASFEVGTSTVTDPSGNTLGCRIYHAGALSKNMPATHCAHAGPAGDQLGASAPAVCSGGNVCESFCTLQLRACGSLDEPLPGNPTDANGNPLFQYQNMINCMENCATFDKFYAYSTTATGDSLACRLLQASGAALDMESARMKCASTGGFPTAPCAGAPMP
jgi:hypothetical protein